MGAIFLAYYLTQTTYNNFRNFKGKSKMTNKLSTQPYKGARDFYPEDMKIRNYIFNTWKSVCKKYGYEEYDFPIVEPLEIFEAKTGQEVVNEQMFAFTDFGNRRIALRPELTPGTVRMLAGKFKDLVKPVRWFMIGNNWRYEKPQKGRGREFYQLEVNIFGVEGPEADFEIIQIAIDIMKAFKADENMFKIVISDRRLISMLLVSLLGLNEDVSEEVRRIMDKKSKMSLEDFNATLNDLGLTLDQISKINLFMTSEFSYLKTLFPMEMLNANQGYIRINKLFKMLENQDLMRYCQFDPSIIRGFDYSDGLVYEVFDTNPTNRRSMFGGERFDKLIKIFNDNYNLEATGFAMGDVTLKEFLIGWNLLPEFNEKKYLVTLWPENSETYRYNAVKIAQSLREKGLTVLNWLEGNTPLNKQLKFANKVGADYVVIQGEDEIKKNIYQIKNLKTGEQLIEPLVS